MRDLLMIILTPTALIAGALIGSKRHHLDRHGDLGFRRPRARDALIYGVLFIALAALFEWLYRNAGGDPAPADWRARYQGSLLLIRVLFAAAVYPIAEELFFRGFLLALLRRKVGAVIAVLVTAIGFTALHSLGESWAGRMQIFTDGVFFAVARLRSGSLYLPMAFHVAGNTFAVMQRLV